MAERVKHWPAVFLARRSASLFDYVIDGDVDRFARQAEEGVAICLDQRLRWLADAHVFAGLAGFWRGDRQSAAEHLRAAAATAAPPIYTGRYSATLLTYLAWVGDADAFDTLVEELHRAFERQGFVHTLGTMAVTLAEVEGLALLGRSAAAAARYPQVLAILEDGVVVRPPDLRIVAALAGLAAALSGDREAAKEHFQEARRLLVALPFPRQAPDVDFLQAIALDDDALFSLRRWEVTNACRCRSTSRSPSRGDVTVESERISSTPYRRGSAGAERGKSACAT